MRTTQIQNTKIRKTLAAIKTNQAKVHTKEYMIRTLRLEKL